jgi:hypothetical protein
MFSWVLFLRNEYGGKDTENNKTFIPAPFPAAAQLLTLLARLTING